MAEAAMVTIEAQETNASQETGASQEINASQKTDASQKTGASQETDVLQKTAEEGGEEEMLPDETAIAACPDGEKIASPSAL